jgi:hypothetical protein
MLAHCAYEISSGQDCVLRPPEEYVLNVAQIALTAAAQGLGKTSANNGNKLPKVVPPTVVLVTSKNLQGEDVTSTVCTLDASCRQCSVALSFGWDEDVTFSLHPGGGQGPVSLTGYLQPSPDGMDNEDDMGYDGEEGSEDSGEDDEEEEGSSEDDDEEDEGMAPLLVGKDKRKRSFDLDADALESRSHNLVAAAEKKKEARNHNLVAAAEKKKPKVAPPPPVSQEDDEDEEDDDEDESSSEGEDDDEELDEQVREHPREC